MKQNSAEEIFKALRGEDCDTFLALIGDDIDATGDFGRTLLHEAIAHSKVDAAIGLIARGARLDAQDNQGRTPLHYAAMFGQSSLANELLRAGANVNEVDIHGNNPLWTAILNPKVDRDLIRSLVHHGADVESLNKAGRSARGMANAIGDQEILDILEKNGAQ
ncbi:ankyrin repeat domain-containing protein [Novosphingobium beihaiensis]|uniref:Ankyrin repeat domain-containing protein n=1 Tax=Novosphingobium beihaiensis TaxID=2930389 RepID=A0ABT0BPK4_9SPHN|nr:ankyrin repeat domain-containing protein [Novosphingobium beihaiensis]MCJ2186969.1 ankyrin repeat domain-containing protein [Novosphingobium beihaiensis]